MALQQERDDDAYKSCESLMNTLAKAQNDLVRCRTQIYSLEAMLIRAEDGSLPTSVRDHSLAREPQQHLSKTPSKQSNDPVHLLKSTLSHMSKDKRLFMDKLRSVLNAQIMLQDQVKKLQDQIMPVKGDESVSHEAAKKGTALFSKVQSLQSHMSNLEKSLSSMIPKIVRESSVPSQLKKTESPEGGTNNNNSEMNPMVLGATATANYISLTREIKKLRTAADIILRRPKVEKDAVPVQVRFDHRTERHHPRRSASPPQRRYVRPFRWQIGSDSAPRRPPPVTSPPRRERSREHDVQPRPRLRERGTSPIRVEPVAVKSSDHQPRSAGAQQKTVATDRTQTEEMTRAEKSTQCTGLHGRSRTRGDQTEETRVVSLSVGVQVTEKGRSGCEGDTALVCTECASRKSSQASAPPHRPDMLHKSTSIPPVRTKNYGVQTPHTGVKRRSIGCQHDKSPSATSSPPPPRPCETLERSCQADVPPTQSRNSTMQTEVVATATTGAQSEGPSLRSHGVQVVPPPPPPPPCLQARAAQTEQPAAPAPKASQMPPRESASPHRREHRRCHPRGRRKSPIAYYRACRECRCRDSSPSPTKSSHDEFCC